jgi:LPS export ABC transporter protein LptC
VLFRIFTVLAVVALGIATWFLSSPAHRPGQSLQAGAADLPGYYLEHAVLTDYDAAGAPTIKIEAERIDQIDHTPEVALFSVRVDYRAPNGQNWVLFGDRAHVRPGGKVVDVAGNVRLLGEGSGKAPAAVVHTDSLSYDVPDAVASTEQEVRIDFGAQTLSGHGLVANLKERTMRLESRVYGRFQP